MQVQVWPAFGGVFWKREEMRKETIFRENNFRTSYEKKFFSLFSLLSSPCPSLLPYSVWCASIGAVVEGVRLTTLHIIFSLSLFRTSEVQKKGLRPKAEESRWGKILTQFERIRTLLPRDELKTRQRSGGKRVEVAAAWLFLRSCHDKYCSLREIRRLLLLSCSRMRENGGERSEEYLCGTSPCALEGKHSPSP